MNIEEKLNTFSERVGFRHGDFYFTYFEFVLSIICFGIFMALGFYIVDTIALAHKTHLNLIRYAGGALVVLLLASYMPIRYLITDKHKACCVASVRAAFDESKENQEFFYTVLIMYYKSMLKYDYDGEYQERIDKMDTIKNSFQASDEEILLIYIYIASSYNEVKRYFNNNFKLCFSDLENGTRVLKNSL